MTTEELSKLTLNYLSESDYKQAKAAGELDENQLYLTPDSSNPSGGVSGVGTQVIFDSVSTIASKTIELTGLDFDKNVDYELYVEGTSDALCGIYLRLNENAKENFFYMEGGYQYQDPSGHLGPYTHASMHAQYENGFHIGTRMCADAITVLRYRFRILDSGRIMVSWECESATDIVEPYYAKGWGYVSEEHWGKINAIYLICTGTVNMNVGTKFIIRRLG